MSSYTPGPRGAAILMSNADGRWFDAVSAQASDSCLKLHDRGLLERDTKSSKLFRISARGARLVRERGDALRRRGR